MLLEIPHTPSNRIPIRTETEMVCHILQRDGALTPREAKRMRLRPPTLHKCRQEWSVEGEVPQLDDVPESGLYHERHQPLRNRHKEGTTPVAVEPRQLSTACGAPPAGTPWPTSSAVSGAGASHAALLERPRGAILSHNTKGGKKVPRKENMEEREAKMSESRVLLPFYRRRPYLGVSGHEIRISGSVAPRYVESNIKGRISGPVTPRYV
ncbi:hypothetical protein PIB30_045732 [Stylosanthes scabra]|uniref:Uncharacterized protein n=1 Tax=Stylosanthes scabra TaxID=79078 RepID=A0ABU6YDL4_9FABA|nr:hypothetical protein [Stylosanthes scabra]